MSRNRIVFEVRPAPSGRGYTLLFLEDPGEMAGRNEARDLGDFGDVLLGVPEHAPLGIFQPQVSDPVAERKVVGRLDVSRR